MKNIQYTQFRNNAKKYFNQVKEGESFLIVRKGEPIAEIIPISKGKLWKRRVKRVTLSNTKKTTTEFIREERDGE